MIEGKRIEEIINRRKKIVEGRKKREMVKKKK